jgi:unsaturated rhamnogalacturonyl hydrolase
MAGLTSFEVEKRLRRAAESLVDYPSSGWFYGDSVGFEGLLAASELLGDPRWAGYVRGFMRGWATRAAPYREMDNTVPGRALCVVVERHRDKVLRDAAADLAKYLRERPTIGDGVFTSFQSAPLREPYGGAPLSPDEVALLADPGPGVYVDCLHFDPPFLVHLGRLLDDDDMVDVGANQALGYVSMLQDDTSGLFHHFWLQRTSRPYVLGWARGQGWALLGLLDVLEQLPPDHRAFVPLRTSMQALASAMCATQRPTGAWWAVAQSPASGSEASTEAFMAEGLSRAVERGWLPREPYLTAAAAAWRATLDDTDAEGVLRDVSAAVWSSTSDFHYHHVPKGFVVPWGQGPLLLAAARWHRSGTQPT